VKTCDTSTVVRILVDRPVIIIYNRRGAAVIIIGISQVLLGADIHGIFLSKGSRFERCLGIFTQVPFLKGQAIFFIIA